MKKRTLNSLNLNKKSISKLFGAGPPGGTVVSFNTAQYQCNPTGASEIGNLTVCVEHTCKCPPIDRLSDVPGVC